MKVLVTGATGFLGSHLTDVLLAEGDEVRALVRPSSDVRRLERQGVERVLGSLETGEGLEAALEGVDAVVHAAGLVKARRPEDFHEVNAEGTRRLLDAARRRPKLRRFVLVSSLEAHGPSLDGAPRPAEDPCRPITHYGRSKVAAEELVRAAAADLPVTVVRPTAIYGPRDQEMYAFFQAVSRHVAPLVGGGENRVTVVYGPDCARAIRQVVTNAHPSGRTYFIDDGRIYAWRELIGILKDVLGVRALELPLPRAAFSLAALFTEAYGGLTGRAVMLTRDKVKSLTAPNWVSSSEPLQREVGWAPEHDFASGARETVAWYRAHGWL